jgi:hypothetical protein
MPQISTCDCSYTPLCAEPRLQSVFFHVRRTLSCEIVSMITTCTSLSAIRWRGHRPYPSGGSLQAIILTGAATRLSILRGRPRRGASWRTSGMGAYSMSRYFFRMLPMVPHETPKMVVSSFAGLSSSKSSKMPALLMARALVFPWATNFSKMSRAGAVNRTALRFLGILHSAVRRRVYRKRLHSPKTFAKDHLVTASTNLSMSKLKRLLLISIAFRRARARVGSVMTLR